MKILLSLILLITSMSSFAMSKAKIAELLNQKGVSILELERQGAKVLMGEVTGHSSALPFSKVKVLITESEAILKNEIDSVFFRGSEILGNLSSVRYNGQYLLKEDVKATIVLH